MFPSSSSPTSSPLRPSRCLRATRSRRFSSVGRFSLSLSLFARGRRKRARARTTRSRLISSSCVVERAGQKSETFDSRASARSNSRSSAFERSSAIVSTVSTSRANAQRGRASRAVARPRDTLENLRRLDRRSRRRERASHDERRRTSDVVCDRTNARPNDVPRANARAKMGMHDMT